VCERNKYVHIFLFHYLKLNLIVLHHDLTDCVYSSGILAAKTLHDSGIQDILILEANSKIGGRIHSVQFRGHTVELGANWVIGGGPRSNHLYEIASKLNLKTYLSDYGNISANIYKQE
jgi:polyamine oxidase